MNRGHHPVANANSTKPIANTLKYIDEPVENLVVAMPVLNSFSPRGGHVSCEFFEPPATCRLIANFAIIVRESGRRRRADHYMQTLFKSLLISAAGTAKEEEEKL